MEAARTMPDAPWFSGTSGGGYTYTWTQPVATTWGDNTTIAYPQPFVAVPVTPVEIPPVDDSPLAWLRSQVSEVCELARAA